MIKFFIFLISIIVCHQQSLAQNNISGIEKLIKENVDLESLGLDNIEKPTVEPKKDIPKSNLIDTITKVEENNNKDLKISEEIATKTKEDINKITKKNTAKLPKKPIKKPLKKRQIVKNKSKKINKKNTSKKPKDVEVVKEDVDDLQELEDQNNLENEPKIESKSNSRNKIKKSILRSDLERKERLAFNAKEQQEKLKKFEELKRFYLSDLIENEDSLEEDFDNEEKIIPKRKELAPLQLKNYHLCQF
jgi:hypothetical protein